MKQGLITGCSVSGGMTNQSIPIVLPVSTRDKERLQSVPALALQYEGRTVAILRTPEFYEHRKEERCARQFGTTHGDHPYIKVKHFGRSPLSYKQDFHIFVNNFYPCLTDD